jgi:hypothetical protein
VPANIDEYHIIDAMRFAINTLDWMRPRVIAAIGTRKIAKSGV